MSKTKLAIFWAILVAIPLLVGVLAILGYYLYGYLTFKVDYCRSFAALDDQVGWVLEPDTTSCIEGRFATFGDPAFNATVYTNADGARTGPDREASASGGILAIGDSWTFGYGINWRDTFAARLAEGAPVALFASPAYSGAQALLLGQRAVTITRPKYIVYLELGFWGRAVCTGTSKPTGILKPCYWVDASGAAQLVTPPAGHVSRMATVGLRPGGMVGAGEKTLSYFLIARPLAKLNGLLVRLGLRSGFINDFEPVAPEAQLAAIKAAHYANLVALARDAGAVLVLIDPQKVYLKAREAAMPAADIIYVDTDAWHTAVEEPMKELPPDQAHVPSDGHYGPGTHRLIADLIARAIAADEERPGSGR